ncbi:MAG TPA: DNA primase, partial [Gemmataceae bacterium]|nr:DNA primase [Gemmataceae bacterium]
MSILVASSERTTIAAAQRWRANGPTAADSAPWCCVTDDWAALRERVRDANDIVDIVGERLALRPAGAIHKALCPFHADKNPSLTVDPRRQRYKCWACGEGGDVFSFVQKFDKVTYPEALELLARRGGISLEKVRKKSQGPSRAGMLDVMKWAGDQFHQCLLDTEQAEAARCYLGERKLTGETVRKYTLGYAPAGGEWLVRQAASAGIPADMLEQVGLIARRNDERRGYYDRFRDRVIFPIRDITGRIVGFGGRILPSSPVSAERAPPKYYNSAETAIFSKSENLYGIDAAKQAAAKVGYLAIVEGYTDVLMAHQHGIAQVVATMGTALNERHIKRLKNVAQRVVL